MSCFTRERSSPRSSTSNSVSSGGARSSQRSYANAKRRGDSLATTRPRVFPKAPSDMAISSRSTRVGTNQEVIQGRWRSRVTRHPVRRARPR